MNQKWFDKIPLVPQTDILPSDLSLHATWRIKGNATNDVRHSPGSLGLLTSSFVWKKIIVTKGHRNVGPFLSVDFYPNLWF